MISKQSYRYFTLFGVVVFLVLTACSWAQVIAGSPEDKAYQAIARETDDTKRIQLLDAFLKNFPNTADLAQIYEFYAGSYRSLGQADKEIEYLEKSLSVRKDAQLMMMMARAITIKGENYPKAIQTIKQAMELAAKSKNDPPLGVAAKDWVAGQEGVIATGKDLLAYAQDRYRQTLLSRLPAESDPNKIIALLDEYTANFDDPDMKPLVYDLYMRNYLRLGNRDKVLQYAEKAMALNPNNVDPLVFTTSAYLEKPMDLEAALGQSQKAVAIADALDSQAKPAGLTDDQWNKQKNLWKATAYSSRGLVRLQNETTLEQALADLEKARDFSPEDGVIQYRLGIAYWKSKKIDEAIMALAKSSTVSSSTQSQATQLLETYYKAAHNGSTVGLKELIDKVKGPTEKPNGI
jgi:tetratricopeptide (TPR) repeat protein